MTEHNKSDIALKKLLELKTKFPIFPLIYFYFINKII